MQQAVNATNKSIEKNNKLGMMAITLQLTKDSKVPFLKGALKQSGLRNSQANLKEGVAKWSTPYAQRQYYEHKSFYGWDIRAWNRNEQRYIDMYAKVQEDNLWK